MKNNKVYIENLPPKKELINNLNYCKSWEEKILYIIKLGKCLKKLPFYLKKDKYLIKGCQSNVWIIIKYDIYGNIRIYGNSNTYIVKGLLSIIFIIYKGLIPIDIIKYKIFDLLNKLEIFKNITFIRSQGIIYIINYIHKQLYNFI